MQHSGHFHIWKARVAELRRAGRTLHAITAGRMYWRGFRCWMGSILRIRRTRVHYCVGQCACLRRCLTRGFSTFLEYAWARARERGALRHTLRAWSRAAVFRAREELHLETV